MVKNVNLVADLHVWNHFQPINIPSKSKFIDICQKVLSSKIMSVHSKTVLMCISAHALGEVCGWEHAIVEVSQGSNAPFFNWIPGCSRLCYGKAQAISLTVVNNEVFSNFLVDIHHGTSIVTEFNSHFIYCQSQPKAKKNQLWAWIMVFLWISTIFVVSKSCTKISSASEC